MTDLTKYDFGYSWSVSYVLIIPLAMAAGLLAVSLWRGWKPWINIVSGVVIAWSLAGLYIATVVWGINRPATLPTDKFLARGGGRVLDVGAGSGRAGIGVLLARPEATVTALDLYAGYYGIEGNTPERFMRNARIAKVADRAEAHTGDMRSMPFPDSAFDAVISSYAIDHVGRNGRGEALHEVARVLRSHGEFLLMIVNTDWWTFLVSPPMAHHFRPNADEWRRQLNDAGFTVEEEGRKPLTMYWMTRKTG